MLRTASGYTEFVSKLRTVTKVILQFGLMGWRF